MTPRRGFDDKVKLAQLASLRGQQAFALLAQLAAQTVVVVLSLSGNGWRTPWTWYGIAVTAVSTAYGAGRYLTRPQRAEVDPAGSLRMMALVELIYGLAWLLCGWMLIDSQAPFAALYLLVVVFALLSGVPTTAGVHFASVLLFTVPILGSLALRFVTLDDPSIRVLGVGVIVYAILYLWSVFDGHRVLLEAIKLRVRNEELAASERTARDRAELALAAAERANAEKTRFLAAASHDLRQPVHAIGLFVAALRAESLSERPRYLVERLGRSLDGLDELFNRLLDISRLDSGGIRPNLGSINAQALAQTLEARFAALAVQRGLQLRVRVTAGLELHSDRDLLTEILSNLLANALLYTNRGKVLLALRGAGELARILVVDTGIGIAAEHHSRVFDEFVQLGNVGHDRRKGLGLGLAIVRRLADMLDHPIALRSTPGRGTAFELTVPRLPRVPVDPLAGGLIGATDHSLAGTMIAVVDDEQDVLDAMAALLTSWGCFVIAAHSPGSAAELVSLGARYPDLIISDHRLAGNQTSLDVVEALEAVLPAPVPVIIVSGENPAVVERLARQRGWGFVAKPVNPLVFRAALAEALARADSAG